MANINDVIGSILQNLSEARSSADNLSKFLSEGYRNDPILRLFPVPRTEIRNVEIDLKFGITDVKPKTTNLVNKSAKRDAAILKFSNDFISEISKEVKANEGKSEEFDKLAKELNNQSFKDSLAEKVSDNLKAGIDLDKDIAPQITKPTIDILVNIDKDLTKKLPAKGAFEFEINKNEKGEFGFKIEDIPSKKVFTNDKPFKTEKAALKAITEVIDKGTRTNNFAAVPAKSSGKVEIQIRDGDKVLARSDVIDSGKPQVKEKDIEKIHTEFLDRSGLRNRLNSIKRTNAFKSAVSTGAVPTVKALDTKPIIDNSVSKVLPAFQKEIAEISKGTFDFDVTTELKADVLSQLPENAISSIKLIAGIENYSWTKIIRDDGTETRKLVDE